MRDVLDQISKASAAGLYYVALLSALAIPDICAALEASDGRATGDGYASWYDGNIGTHPANGQDIYRFRCALLHQGRTSHPLSAFSRIIFIEPGATTNVLHNCLIGDALMIDVRSFVADIVRAAGAWLVRVENTEPYTTNRLTLVARHPEGLIPYVTGVPIIG